MFNYCLGFLQASPILSQEVLGKPTSTEIRLRNGNVISVHANSYRTVRGRTMLCVIFDEVAQWRDETSALPDLETYRAVLPSLATTKGMLIGISITLPQDWPYCIRSTATPSARTTQRCWSWQDPRASSIQLSIRPSSIAAIKDDPEAARAEWEGEFQHRHCCIP